jgi:hypothetical protein
MAKIVAAMWLEYSPDFRLVHSMAFRAVAMEAILPSLESHWVLIREKDKIIHQAVYDVCAIEPLLLSHCCRFDRDSFMKRLKKIAREKYGDDYGI